MIYDLINSVRAAEFEIETPLPKDITVWGIVNSALNLIIPLSSVALTIFIVYGGITYMTSVGDPGKVKSAQQMITNAIIGFVIVSLAFVIKRIVETMVGI